MTKLIVFCNHIFLLLLLLITTLECSSFANNKNKAYQFLNETYNTSLPAWILKERFNNCSKDHSFKDEHTSAFIKNEEKTSTPPIPKIFSTSSSYNCIEGIVSFKNNIRNISVSSITAMKEILTITGCLNGAKIKKLMQHTLVGNIDTWEVECNGNNYEKIILHLTNFKSEDEIYKKTIKPKILQADILYQKKYLVEAMEIYKNILKLEPAYPVARLRLGIYYSKQNNCNLMLENLIIFLRTFPAYPDKEKLIKLMQKSCPLEKLN